MTIPQVIILGVGPAGLGASHTLHRAGMPFVAVEKNPCVGGLSRTLTFGEFKTDIGPHRFYSQDQSLYGLIAGLLGEDWQPVKRYTRFYVNGRFFRYPIELLPTLAGLGPIKSLRILIDYLGAQLGRRFTKQPPRSFEEAAIAQFGRALAELNMLNYTEKIWGLPCAQISPDWLGQRVAGLSLLKILRSALVPRSQGPKTLVDEFYYPTEGTGMIYQRIYESVRATMPDAFLLESRPRCIYHEPGRITRLDVQSGEAAFSFEPRHVVSSIPLPELVQLLEPAAPRLVQEAGQRLRFRAHVALLLILRRQRIVPDQWIYFPERDIPFGRLMEPKNFSRRMAPDGQTSMVLEFFCQKGDAVWQASADELRQTAVAHLERLGLATAKDIEAAHVHREAEAYPLYELDYETPVAVIKEYLRDFKNLQLVGRGGCFRYNNQDHALAMGIAAAGHIIAGRPYSLEGPPEAAGYFEYGSSAGGKVPDKTRKKV